MTRQSEHAEEFLRRELAAGPQQVRDLRAAAERADLAWMTVRRAADALGVQKRKARSQGGTWSWQLKWQAPDTRDERR